MKSELACWVDVCRQVLASCTQLQNRSFYVVDSARMPAKGLKLKKRKFKACKSVVFHF